MLMETFETAPASPQGPPENPYQTALAELLRTFKPERALVLKYGGTFAAAAWSGFDIPDPNNLIALPLSTSILYQVLESQQPLACRDIQASMGLNQRWSIMASEIRSLICVPFWGSRGALEGLLYVDSRREDDFNEPESRLEGAPPEQARSRQIARACEIADRLTQRLRGEEPASRPKPGRGQRKAPPPTELVPAALSRLRPAPAALAPFLRSLATLLEAGVPLPRALEVLQHSCEDPRLARITFEVQGLILKGVPLSLAMREFKRAFPPAIISLVRGGERIGGLVVMLAAAAAFQEKLQASWLRLRSSLTYPAIVLGLVTLMVLLLPPLMLRGPLQLLQAQGANVSAPTRALMALASLLAQPWFWPVLILVLVGLAEAARRLLQSRPRRLQAYQLALRLPLVGRLLRLASAARFCHSMAIMAQAGVSFVENLELATQVSLSPVLEANLPAARHRLLEEGKSLQASLAALEFLPGHFLEFVGAGEESGQLPQMLQRMGDCYQLELEAALEVYLALLEPLVMLILGAVVAAVLLASLLPMMQVLETL